MKITRNMKKGGEPSRRERKIDARANCHKCPNCLSTVSDGKVIEEGYRIELHRGILSRIDLFTCDSCGEEWESDPYPHVIPIAEMAGSVRECATTHNVTPVGKVKPKKNGKRSKSLRKRGDVIDE